MLIWVWIWGIAALKWFGPEGGDPIDYEGGRDLDSLAKLSVAYHFYLFLASPS